MHICQLFVMLSLRWRSLLPFLLVILLVLSNRLALQAAQPASQVRDINPTGNASPYELTNINGILYFVANDGVHGNELWRSDGTAMEPPLVPLWLPMLIPLIITIFLR
jgi:hypothetical protein